MKKMTNEQKLRKAALAYMEAQVAMKAAADWSEEKREAARLSNRRYPRFSKMADLVIGEPVYGTDKAAIWAKRDAVLAEAKAEILAAKPKPAADRESILDASKLLCNAYNWVLFCGDEDINWQALGILKRADAHILAEVRA